MSAEQPLTPEQLARQAREHLESLRAAGVEWLPTAPPPAVVVTAASPSLPVVTEPAPVREALFAADEARSAGDSLTLQQRQAALAALAQRVSQCMRCAQLASTRTQTVFGVGALDPDLCFLGEAPGADEDRKGEPFVGAAGQLLNRIIAACGMKREEVYICNILRCRPPGNRLPLADEAANCRDYLDQTLELVRPKFLCCLGACAAQNLLGTTLSVGRLRGAFHEFRGITVAVTYHPAYLLRNEAAKKDVWEDMKKLLARMGKPVPGAKK
ncbi:MAG TPA: uracil-DNA glycosylase [Gemmataceae bacterium]|nr:uracil-DNA glycosylase [Gemmataceae bacterium]